MQASLTTFLIVPPAAPDVAGFPAADYVFSTSDVPVAAADVLSASGGPHAAVIPASAVHSAAGVSCCCWSPSCCKTHVVVGFHACKLAVAVNDNAELAPLLLLSSLLWLGLPAGRTGKHSST